VSGLRRDWGSKPCGMPVVVMHALDSGYAAIERDHCEKCTAYKV